LVLCWPLLPPPPRTRSMIWIHAAVVSPTARIGQDEQGRRRHNARQRTKDVKGRESSQTDDSSTIPMQVLPIGQVRTILTRAQLIDPALILMQAH
jgi:hypothetical protein